MKPEVGQIDIVIQETFFIHENFVGLIIGRYGGNIRDIQGQSGCRLNFTDETNQGHRICLLQGAKFQIEHAKRLITELIRKRRDVQNQPMNNNSEEGEKILHILIPAARCRMVIGKGGEKIREMSTHFDVHMHLIQDNNDDRAHDKFLEIRGKSEKVDKAHNYVQENFVDGSGLFRLPNKDLSGSENKLTRKVTIQPRFMKFMIGKNGSVIKDIQLKSGATVAVNHEGEDPNSEHFAIVEGTEGQVENAIKMIKDKMSPRVHQTQSYFHRVRRDKALQLIANRSYLLNQIRIRSKTKISYRDDQVSGDYVFEIHGRHSQIQNAIYLMEQDLGSKTNPLSHSMHYPLVMNMAAPIPLYHGNARVLGDPAIESRGNFCYSAPGTAGTALHGLATGNLQHNGYGDAPVYNQVI
uniref:K Homology domain-containing protein n=1 Tax=Acrobeloides nanus TaxID=290746 RepID=A0A914C2C5_9BILA